MVVYFWFHVWFVLIKSELPDSMKLFHLTDVLVVSVKRVQRQHLIILNNLQRSSSWRTLLRVQILINFLLRSTGTANLQRRFRLLPRYSLGIRVKLPASGKRPRPYSLPTDSLWLPGRRDPYLLGFEERILRSGSRLWRYINRYWNVFVTWLRGHIIPLKYRSQGHLSGEQSCRALRMSKLIHPATRRVHPWKGANQPQLWGVLFQPMLVHIVGQ